MCEPIVQAIEAVRVGATFTALLVRSCPGLPEELPGNWVDAMKRVPGFLRAALVWSSLIAIAGLAHADPVRWQLNMAPGVTETSQAVYDLHMIVLGICVVIAIIVFGAMAYCMFAFRKSRGAVADTTLVHSTWVEIVWTTVPVIVLIVMAVPSTKTLIRMSDVRDAELTVKVTGYQWKWRYEYVGTDVNFISSLARDSDRTRQLRSGLDPAALAKDGVNTYLLDVDKPLVLPIDTKIRFIVTADDVIHAWWVPQLGWKQDAIPGFINEAWTDIKTPGTYRGVCAELCGKDHGFMPIVVEAVPKAEFQRWLAAQPANPGSVSAMASNYSAPTSAAGATATAAAVPPIAR